MMSETQIEPKEPSEEFTTSCQIKINKLELDSDNFSSFLKVPCELDAGIDPMQLHIETAQLSANNPFFGHADGCGFVCEKDGALVGRVFASLDKNLRQDEGQVVGHVGYFDCVDDVQCVQALLAEAEGWLKDKGATHVHGPVNLNIYTGYRVQMSGFDTAPFPGEPRDPKHHGELLQAAGYEVLTTWSSWDLTLEYMKVASQYYKDMVAKLPVAGVNLRAVNAENLAQELTELYEPGMKAFSMNYGFSKISLEEFLSAYMPLQPLITKDYFYIFSGDDGKIGGFAIGYVDAPQNPSRIIFHSIGMLKEWYSTPAPYLMAVPIWEAAVESGLPAIGGLAKEGKTTFDRQGPPSRTYSILTKAL